MKILIVLDTLSAGGAEITAMKWASRANMLGYTTELFVFHKRLTNQRTIDKNLKGVKVHFAFSGKTIDRFASLIDRAFKKVNLSYSIRESRIKKKLKRLQEKEKYTVIQSHLFNVDHLVAESLSSIDVPLFTTIHGDYLRHYHTPSKERKIDRFKEKLDAILSAYSGVICITDQQIEFFRNTLQSSIPLRKIYNGYAKIENISARTKNEGKTIFGMVSRGIREKGWEIAINAFEGIEGDAELWLIGDSPYLRELENQNKNSNVKFLGFQPDPLKVLKEVDIGLLPSYYGSESLPTVVIEYLISGIPVIATDIGEIRNMITLNNGQSAGVVIPLSAGKPDANTLRDRMIELMSSRTLLLESSETAAKCAQKFDLDTCIESYISFYNANQ